MSAASTQAAYRYQPAKYSTYGSASDDARSNMYALASSRSSSVLGCQIARQRLMSTCTSVASSPTRCATARASSVSAAPPLEALDEHDLERERREQARALGAVGGAERGKRAFEHADPLLVDDAVVAVEAAAVGERGVGEQLDVARPLGGRGRLEQRRAELDLARALLRDAEPVAAPARAPRCRCRPRGDRAPA